MITAKEARERYEAKRIPPEELMRREIELQRKALIEKRTEFLKKLQDVAESGKNTRFSFGPIGFQDDVGDKCSTVEVERDQGILRKSVEALGYKVEYQFTGFAGECYVVVSW